MTCEGHTDPVACWRYSAHAQAPPRQFRAVGHPAAVGGHGLNEHMAANASRKTM